MLLGSGGGAASGAAIAIVDTAGAGGFWTPGVFIPEDATGSQPISGAANGVRASQFILPFRATVGKVTIQINTLEAGKVAAVGIYDSSGAKLIDSGTFDVGSTGFKQNSFTAVTLQPGVYYWVQSCDGTVAAITTVITALGSAANTFVNQGSASRRANVGNAMAGGVLPATLGVLTDGGFNSPIGYWET